jgi:membrane protease YdiL (CAAX protease family)
VGTRGRGDGVPGLLWGAAAKRGWSWPVATLVSAVPFALIHVEPLRTVPLLLSGVAFGVVRHHGGLGAAMLAHLLVNGAAGAATVATLLA